MTGERSLWKADSATRLGLQAIATESLCTKPCTTQEKKPCQMETQTNMVGREKKQNSEVSIKGSAKCHVWNHKARGKKST